MAPDQPPDRQAYLEEQIARQKRGEPIDVEWVRTELERVRTEQARMGASMERNLRWLVLLFAALLVVLWIQNGGPNGRGGVWILGLILIGGLAAWALGRKRR